MYSRKNLNEPGIQPPTPPNATILMLVWLLKMMDIRGNPVWFELQGSSSPRGVGDIAGFIEN